MSDSSPESSWRRTGLRSLLSLWAAALTAACHHAPSTPADNTVQPAAATPSTTVSAGAGDPCVDGPSGCVQVGRADVDGDGQLERIGVAVDKPPPVNGTLQPGTIFIRVATSTGVQALQVDAPLQLPKSGSPTDVFVGAFLISHPHGADLVVQTARGIADDFAVISSTRGALVMLPAPPKRNSKVSLGQRWALTQSEGFRETITCTDGTAINLVHDVAPLDEGEPVPGGGRREISRYAFANNEWVLKDFQSIPRDQFSYNEAASGAFLCGDQRR